MMSLIVTVGAQVAVTALVLFLSALGIFSLVSISVSRRTREIGLRAALGANPRQVLAGILSRARGAHGERHRSRRRPSAAGPSHSARAPRAGLRKTFRSSPAILE